MNLPHIKHKFLLPIFRAAKVSLLCFLLSALKSILIPKYYCNVKLAKIYCFVAFKTPPTFSIYCPFWTL